MRTAQTVQIEDIPLPDVCEKSPAPQPQLPLGSLPLPPNFPPQIPPGGIQIPPSIQSAIAAHQKATAAAAAATAAVAAEEKSSIEPKRKDPPGCPPGPPPNLLLMSDLDSDYESEDSDRGRRSPISKRPRTRRYSSDRSSNRSDDRNSDSESEVDVPKPTSVQQRMLAIAGQKYDDFMKELENVHSQSSDDRQSSKQSERKRSDEDSRSGDESKRDSDKPPNHMKKGDEGGPQALRKENPASIPNLSSVPAPPMPPPMLHKMPRPPPPPMGNFPQ